MVFLFFVSPQSRQHIPGFCFGCESKCDGKKTNSREETKPVSYLWQSSGVLAGEHTVSGNAGFVGQGGQLCEASLALSACKSKFSDALTDFAKR